VTATPILDTLDDEPQAAVELAGRLIDDLLAEVRTLESLDAQMYPQRAEAAARQRSRLVFDAWHRWISEAESLLRRLITLKRQGAALPRLQELRQQIALARCTVKMTLEKVEHARDQARRSETISGEEVRRELQLRAGGGRSG
jgi:hypothetical protein